MRNINLLEKYCNQFGIKLNSKNCYSLDFETGGLSSWTDGICSMTLRNVILDKTYNYLIRPKANKVYKMSALEINKLNIETLNKDGISVWDLGNKLLSQFQFEDYVVLIGQNIDEFDIKYLLQIFKENGNSTAVPPMITIDTKVLADKLDIKTKFNINSLSLGVMFKAFCDAGRIDKSKHDLLNKAHHSESDTLMCEEVLAVLLEEYYKEV